MMRLLLAALLGIGAMQPGAAQSVTLPVDNRGAALCIQGQTGQPCRLTIQGDTYTVDTAPAEPPVPIPGPESNFWQPPAVPAGEPVWVLYAWDPKARFMRPRSWFLSEGACTAAATLWPKSGHALCGALGYGIHALSDELDRESDTR
jgi:hypothetical protein